MSKLGSSPLLRSLVLLGPLAFACGQTEAPRGSLMLAVSTDMYIDKDLSRVDIVVQPENGPTQIIEVNLFPQLDGKFLPGTFAILEGSTPGEFVRIRVIARRDRQVRVVREAALKIPLERTALLSMPIQWLCDGQVQPDGQLYRSECKPDFTCVAGTCQPDLVDEETLPEYQVEEVFGGGSAAGDGSCFDTLPCFADGFEPPLELDSCILQVDPSSELNVAVVLPLGQDGHCDSEKCLVPLDKSPISGWWPTDPDQNVQLPEAVCERVQMGLARVMATTECAEKYPGTPTCGPWSLVGTEPGGSPPPSDLDPFGSVDTAEVIVLLEQATQRILDDAAAACAGVAQASPPGNPTSNDVSQLCGEAASQLQSVTPVTWYHVPSECWPDHSLQLECERECAGGCDSGTLENRCEASAVRGVCDGLCQTGYCTSGQDGPIPCSGSCSGTCEGVCEGICLGQCDGNCDNFNADGYCDGNCDANCVGLCEGQCEGRCEGLCESEVSSMGVSCGSGGLCEGGCDTGYSNPTCLGPLGNNSCPGVSLNCVDNCRAAAHFNLACEWAAAWVMPKPEITDSLMSALYGTIPELLAIRDFRSFIAIEEATFLLDRMSGVPSTPAEDQQKLQEFIDALATAQSSANNFLTSLGDERGSYPQQNGLGMGPGASAFGPLDCSVVASDGGRPLVDDFEDGDNNSLVEDGRNGEWFLAHDGTGTIGPSEPPYPEAGGPGTSNFAMHVWGSGFTQWGGALAVNLRTGGEPYDASAYQGLRFSARGTNVLRVLFMQQNLDPGHPCSTCDFNGGESCGDFFTAEVNLDTAWTPYQIDWSLLTRGTSNGIQQFGPEQLLTLQFEAPGDFDFWIDDVEFY